tara:strand:- start:11256 stop:12020 length:765 start_codon:yes stop_codon:yes gene_type:complete
MNTTISLYEDILDYNGKMIKSGNYYFQVIKSTSKYTTGKLYNKRELGVFCLKNKDLIEMMAIAQSRLIRCAKIDEKYAPNLPSPNNDSHNINLNNKRHDENNNYVYTNIRCDIPGIVDDGIDSSLMCVNHIRNPKYKKYNKYRKILSKTLSCEKCLYDNYCNGLQEKKEPEMCTICLQPLENKMVYKYSSNKKNIKRRKMKVLKCFHKFHKNCIKEWFYNNNTCPVCRLEHNDIEIYNMFYTSSINNDVSIENI